VFIFLLIGEKELISMDKDQRSSCLDNLYKVSAIYHFASLHAQTHKSLSLRLSDGYNSTRLHSHLSEINAKWGLGDHGQSHTAWGSKQ